MTDQRTTEDRVLGALVGLAVGDALGASYEFIRNPSLPDELEMIGGGPWDLEPGEWTDDTSLALCLAESLLARRGFDARDQLKRYLRWKQFGHLSSRPIGHPKRLFDIGPTTREALKIFSQLQKREEFCGDTDEFSAGNGSLMRLAPVAMYFRHNRRFALSCAADSSRTTHGAREAVDACVYFCGLLLGAMAGASKIELVGGGVFEPVPGVWQEIGLAPKVAAIAEGSFRNGAEGEVWDTKYVVHTLKAALWAFWSTDDFAAGCRKVISLGEDTDTTAAVFGQIAGAYYGVSGIPVRWACRLARRELIRHVAERLLREAPTPSQE